MIDGRPVEVGMTEVRDFYVHLGSGGYRLQPADEEDGWLVFNGSLYELQEMVLIDGQLEVAADTDLDGKLVTVLSRMG